jgi:hypothetical protein
MYQIEIENYLQYKSYAWSPRTIKTERSRLKKLEPFITGDPLVLWNFLEAKYSAYTRKMNWQRVVDFWAHTFSYQNNPYKHWMHKNRRLFKHVYKRKELGITYEQAKAKVLEIPCEETKEKALQLLTSGMRWSESLYIHNGQILGKGSKPRKVYAEQRVYSSSYETFWRHLKKVGLTPHMLRKLFATRCVELGMKEADLLKIMGWESIDTAKYYLQPKNDNEIKDFIQENF